MKNTKKLYLASQSPMRKQLLAEAGFTFERVPQTADETLHDKTASLQRSVEELAQRKMKAVVLPQARDQEHCWVITADTLVQLADGTICGKPTDYADALATLKKKCMQVYRLQRDFCLLA